MHTLRAILGLVALLILLFLIVRRRRKPRHRAVRVLINFWVDGVAMSSVTMKADSAGVSATIQATDRKGNPAQVFGTPAWAVSDSTIATVTPAADGLSAQIVPTGAVGSTDVSVTIEGDATPGVDTITGTGTVNVTAAEASQVDLVFGQPA